MTLAIDGGTPRYAGGWPTWPPPATEAQRRLLDEVVGSGKWGSTHGPVNDRLAAAFAEYCDVRAAVPVANGTMTLVVALLALGVQPGDEVIIPSYTFVACATATALIGAVPVLVDVDPTTAHLTAETAAAGLSERTRAIMAVHLAGSPCDLNPILALAAERGIPVIEDAAQAHGAEYEGRRVGGIGTCGSFSFQSSKAMTAGEGGMLTSSDQALADVMWSYANVGRDRGGAWYGHPRLGLNLRLTELQAALLLPWLDDIDGQIEQRHRFVTALDAALAGSGAQRLAEPAGTTRNSHHLAMIDLDPGRIGVDKAWVMQALAAEGVPSGEGYPGLHAMPAVQSVARCLPCPATEALNRSVLWLFQSMLMADGSVATRTGEIIRAVLADPRARA